MRRTVSSWFAVVMLCFQLSAAQAQVNGIFNSVQTSTVPVYDIRAYGAVAGASNVTAAVQAATTAATVTGGIVYFPPGIWNITSAINSACDAIVCVPAVAYTAKTEQVSFVGASRVRQDWQGTTPTAGSIVTSNVTAGTDVNSAIIGVPQVAGNFANLDNVDVYVENLTFRTYPNPLIGCFSGQYASGAHYDGLKCEVGEPYAVGAHTQPTNIVGGVWLPASGNDTLSMMDNSQVTGYYVGIVAGEHARFSGTWVGYGIQGLSVQPGFYPLKGDIGFEEVVTPIFAAAGSGATLDLHVGIEVDPMAYWCSWCYSTTDVHDPTNLLKGFIRYTKVGANIGNMTTPIALSGGLNLSTYNDYTQIWTNNASPRTQSTIGVNPTANPDGMLVGSGWEYGGYDLAIGNWGPTGSGSEPEAGVMQMYSGAGSGNTLGTGHGAFYIQPYGGYTSVGNTGAQTNIQGNPVTANNVNVAVKPAPTATVQTQAIPAQTFSTSATTHITLTYTMSGSAPSGAVLVCTPQSDFGDEVQYSCWATGSTLYLKLTHGQLNLPYTTNAINLNYSFVQ